MRGNNLKCLICSGKLPSSPSIKQVDIKKDNEGINFGSENFCEPVSSLSASPSLSLINQHVHTIFVLKTIFQLPSTRLTKYLKNSPNIEEWISICSNCKQVVSDCQSIYSDLLKIQDKLLASRLNIIKLVKTSHSGNNSSTSDDDDPNDQFCGNSHQFNISQDCRRFIINRKYFL